MVENKRIRVLLACSGVGRVNRGIETFFREAFDGLRATPALDLRLIKGQGIVSANELVSWNLPRTGILARLLGRLSKRNGYVVEQWSSLFSVAAQIRRFRPHVVFYSDANLGFLLFSPEEVDRRSFPTAVFERRASPATIYPGGFRASSGAVLLPGGIGSR